MFYKTPQQKNKNNVWKFTKYDTLLTQLWNKEVIVQKNFDFGSYFYDEAYGKLYLLFMKNETFSISDNLNSREGDLNILSINLKNGESGIISSNIPNRALVNDFKVNGDIAFIAGNYKPSGITAFTSAIMSLTLVPLFTGLSIYKFKPFLAEINLKSGTCELLSKHYKGNSYLLNEQIIINDNKPYLVTIVKNIAARKETYLEFSYFDSNGKLFKTDKIKTSPDTAIVSAQGIKIDNYDFFTGTYKKVHRHKFRFNPFSNALSESTLTSEGFVFAKYTRDKPEFIKYYNFSNFQGFFNRFNDQSKPSDNKSKISGHKSYELLIHDIIKKDNDYILVAEAYYPEYHLEYYMMYGVYNQPYETSREVFDGYRYTYALIAAFNPVGNLLWNNSFEIGNILNEDLKERIKLIFDGDDIVLAYSNEGKIASKIILGNQVVQSKEETPIDNIPLNDNPKTKYTSDMDYWYNNYFISYGLKSTFDNKGHKEKSSTFFFNKIAFQ